MNSNKKFFILVLILFSVWEFILPFPFFLKVAVILFLPFLIKKYPFNNKHALLIFFSLIIWYLYGWISLGWSIADPQRILSYKLNYFISFSLILCVVSVINTEKAFFYALKILFYCGILVLLISFSEFASHRYFFYQDTDIFYADAGWYVPLANQKGPNELVSELLALFIFSLIYLTNKGSKPIVRYVFMLAYGLAIFLTDSRSGLLGFMMVTVIYFMLNKQFKAIKILLFSGIILAVLYVLQHLKSTGASIEEEARWVIWLSYLGKFSETGFMGIGWGSIGSDNNGPVNIMTEGSIHNYFLEVLVEVGIIGFVCFVCLYAYVLIKSYILYRKTNKMNTNFLYIFLFAIGFGITSIGPSSMRQLNDMWLFLAIAIAYCILNENRNTKSIYNSKIIS